MPDTLPSEGIVLSPEQQRRRRVRSLAIGWGLGALVVLFFLVTLVRLSANVGSRPF